MFRAPAGTGLPSVATMLDDIPANLETVAAHLGLKPSTLKTYKAKDSAPRAVRLALFWETRWGRSAADTEAANAAQVYRGETKALQAHAGRLAGIVWRLELELSQAQKSGHHGAANLPVWRVG